MATGRMVTAYWYMPFIFLVFLASPLFDRFIGFREPGARIALVGAAIRTGHVGASRPSTT